MKKYSCAVTTKTGRRHNNQDNYMLAGQYAALDHDHSTAECSGKTSKALFAAVADGMGGEASGERASFEACAELSSIIGSLGSSFEGNKSLIRDSIIRANDRLCGVMQAENSGRMGSTLIAVLLQDDKLYYTNLGDSRIYLLRAGKLYQLTKDHTEGQAMVDAGVLTPEQLKTHPSRNKLSLHLGIFPEEMSIEPARYKDIELAEGDRLLLCSDGVFGVMESETIASILGGAGTVQERSARFVDTAYASGSRDNMTALVIDVQKGAKPVLPLILGGIGLLAVVVALAFIVKNLISNRDPGDTVTETPVKITNPPSYVVPKTDEPTTGPGGTEQPTQEPPETETPGHVLPPLPSDFSGHLFD